MRQGASLRMARCRYLHDSAGKYLFWDDHVLIDMPLFEMDGPLLTERKRSIECVAMCFDAMGMGFQRRSPTLLHKLVQHNVSRYWILASCEGRMLSTAFFPAMIFQPVVTTQTLFAVQVSVYGQHLHHHETYMVLHDVDGRHDQKIPDSCARWTATSPKIPSSHGSKCSPVRAGYSTVSQQMGVSKNNGTPKWMVYKGKLY